jgi:hypothetical protein
MADDEIAIRIEIAALSRDKSRTEDWIRSIELQMAGLKGQLGILEKRKGEACKRLEELWPKVFMGEKKARDAANLDTALAALELAEVALEAVTRIGGNLSDKGIEAVGGIHDAKSRALMVVIARAEARRGLEQIQAVLKQEDKDNERS